MRSRILVFFLLVFTAVTLFGKEPEKQDKKILILPFDNYSGSGLKYLSTYVPELIKKSIKDLEGVRILDAEESKTLLAEKNLKIEISYDKKTGQKVLSGTGAFSVIMGRYIVQGKFLRMDYMALTAPGAAALEGETEDILMDDLFLSALSRFSHVMDTWIKTYILKEDYFKIYEKDENIFIRLLNRVRNSQMGIIVKNRWIFSVLILLFFYFLSKIVALFFEKVLKRITRKTAISMDEEIVDISMKPTKWIVLFFGLKMAIFSLKLSPAINLQFSNITTAVIIILVTYIVSNVVVIVIRSWGHKVASKLDSRIDDDLVPLFVKVSRVIVLSIGIIMVLSRFNVDIAPLIASLGIAGFAIGFAVKDSLANIIGGIVLILDQSFAVGDKVTIDGDTGVIKEVGLRNTKIQTYDNEIIVIPNGDLMNKKFKNSVLPDPMIRVVVEFTVSYGSDVDKVERVVIDALKTIPDIAEDPAPAVVFYQMGDFALNFQAKFWVPDYVNQYGKWIEATKLVYQTLQREGISIPFPTQTVYLEKGEGQPG